MAATRLLIVDDDASIRLTLAKILQAHGFDVTTAGNVSEALREIAQAPFDALLSDLHMPGAGDGLTVVSAMRHANPNAVTLLLSAFPEMSEAANAILLQADEILVKPMKIPDLVSAITQRLAKGPLNLRKVESLATILRRTAPASIEEWFTQVEREPVLCIVTLSREERCQHLPQLFLDLERRLAAFKRKRTPFASGSVTRQA
jgi:DNA-binding NtrC family response regulator